MKKVIFKSAMIAAILSLTVLTSCDDDDDKKGGTVPSQSEKQKLIDKDFELFEFTVFMNGVPFITIDDLDDCDKDDLIHFREDNSGYDDEGATKCDPSDDQRTPFTYELRELSSGNKTLTIDYGGGDNETFNILSNTGSELKLTFSETDSITNIVFRSDISFRTR